MVWFILIVCIFIIVILGACLKSKKDTNEYSPPNIPKKEYKPIEYKLENPEFTDEEDDTNSSFNPTPIYEESELVRQYEVLIKPDKKVNTPTESQSPKQCKVYKSVYDYLLHSPQWLSCRERILRRDNHKCQWCKTVDNLQIHHKYYCKLPNKHLVNPWEYKDDCFMTLCKDCHDKWHKNHSNRVYYRSWRDHQAILKEIKNNERN